MQSKPNISPERLARLQAESQRLRPLLAAEMPAIREEWSQWVESLTSVVARHSKKIDEYIQTHGPMTRPEVVERALTKLLSEL
jgi:phage host-nuclease inhibitor protein Gam